MGKEIIDTVDRDNGFLTIRSKEANPEFIRIIEPEATDRSPIVVILNRPGFAGDSFL